MWTLTDFRRKLLHFDRPLCDRPIVESSYPRYYSNSIDFDKSYVPWGKGVGCPEQQRQHIKYPVLYEEHSDCPAAVTVVAARWLDHTTQFLLLLLVLGVSFVLFARRPRRS